MTLPDPQHRHLTARWALAVALLGWVHQFWGDWNQTQTNAIARASLHQANDAKNQAGIATDKSARLAKVQADHAKRIAAVEYSEP
jgi:hypothetical protein